MPATGKFALGLILECFVDMGAQYTLNSNAEFREGELPDAFTQVTVYHWHFYAADRANTPTRLDATCLLIIFAARPRIMAS